VTVGFVGELVLSALILPRLLLPALVFGAVGFAILWVTRKYKKLFCTAFIAFIALGAALGLLLPVSLPVGPEFWARKPNAAYSLKSTSEDIAVFSEAMLSMYQSDELIMKEMFRPQIRIDDHNSWGLGFAIEEADGVTTYWHSGINPGMQSLFVIAPQANKIVTVMTNSDNGIPFARAVAKDVLDIDGTWEIVRVDLTN
jgi:CubicO group peptidase (beta-lactamase class C family)